MLAQPTAWGLIAGPSISALGEGLRLWAAGHLVKAGGVTRSGPYRHTRNPLYLGSALLGAGFGLATGRVLFLVGWVLFFGLVYWPVMRTEEAHLAEKYPSVYPGYAAETPLFWPSIAPHGERGEFRWSQLVANREHHTALGVAAVYLLLLARFAA